VSGARAASSAGGSVVRYPWRRVKSMGRLLLNQMPELTVMHWHGLRMPAAMDGTEVVQRPVQPGETFTYRAITRTNPHLTLCRTGLCLADEFANAIRSLA
jgi:hypothetical protein